MTQNTQNTQTTEDRIYQIMLGSETYAKATYIIAAEIDAKDATIDRLQRELAEARRNERMASAGRGRENVARITHEVWSMWMRELRETVSLPAKVLRRLQTPYHNLHADDQASCLAVADDYIRAIGTPLANIASDTRKERDQALAELAEARAYISTIIDAPGVNNG